MRPTYLAILAPALLAACVTMNPYQQNYSPLMSEKVPHGEPQRLVAADGPPQLLSSHDMRKDAIKLMENGYLPIGRSKFKSQFVDAHAALEQATLVRAALVVVQQEHAGTGTQTSTVTQWSPDRRIVTNESTIIRGDKPEETQVVDRQVVTTIVGEYQTRYVDQTVEYYDHTATFWQKTKPAILGLLVSELDEAQRKGIQSNKGVLAKVVVKQSPAFEADLLRGDIVRRFDGKDIAGVDDFFEKVLASAGKRVRLEWWRDGKMMSKTLQLQAP